MTNQEIAQKIYDLLKKEPPGQRYICNKLKILLLNAEISDDQYWYFLELVWTFVDLNHLEFRTKCKHLDHHYKGPWFNNDYERLTVLHKIINTNITILHYDQ
jgi:hypothetical protein